MALELPSSGDSNIPDVPIVIRSLQPDIYKYLQDLRRALNSNFRDAFNNSLIIATAINSGVSGTFAISSGGHIIVTSGIVISVTS